jgi:sulfotransferase family protein
LDTVKITKVEIEPSHPGLLWAHIDFPVAGTTFDAYAMEVRGWAIAANGPVASVEIGLGARNTTVTTVPREGRPDVASGFPDASHAEQSGFRTVVGVLENRAKFGLELHATLEDGSRLPIGRIEGERRPLGTGLDTAIQPLMLNTIGRSGSTWLAWVLSCHPEVIGYRPMEFETRVATYWTSVFQALAQPQGYLSQLVTNNLESDRRWWLGDGATGSPDIADPPLEAWLGRDAVEQIAAMCQARIEAFFRQAAAAQEKPGARYFLEKFLLEPVVLDLLKEIYGQAREVILVRDFRDVATSVLAFNRKRGYKAFGREHVDSDAEYIRKVVFRQALGVQRRWEEQGDDAHLVRYEDLLTEPQQTLTKTFEFVGLDASSEVVDETLERATSDAPSMDHHRTARDPAATIGRWREDLSPDLIEACAELDHVLEAFAYEGTESSILTASDD